MFAETMAVMILVLFRNHIYKFAGKLWLQDGTGSIGDRATGVIAQYVMIWWCRKFGRKLKDLGIDVDLLEHYIDDINLVCDAVKSGIKYRD